MNHTTPRAHLRPRVRGALALFALSTLVGCASYRVVPSGGIEAPSEVRIRFAAPRTVDVRDEAGNTLPVTDVVALYGRLVEGGSDSVTVELSRAEYRVRGEDRLGQIRFSTGSVTRVPVAEEVAVRQGGSTGKALLLLGVVIVAFVIIGAATAPDPAPPPPKESTTKA